MIPYTSDSNGMNESSRILIIEDEAIVALDIKGRLHALGYSVVGVAASGEKAIELAAEHTPDLILMDIMLEGKMDGIDTALSIKENILFR